MTLVSQSCPVNGVDKVNDDGTCEVMDYTLDKEDKIQSMTPYLKKSEKVFLNNSVIEKVAKNNSTLTKTTILDSVSILKTTKCMTEQDLDGIPIKRLLTEFLII